MLDVNTCCVFKDFSIRKNVGVGYSRLNLSLVRSNARAFLARAGPCAKVSDIYLDG